MSEARRLLIVAALAGAVGGGATIALFGPHPGTRAQDKPPVAGTKTPEVGALKDASAAFRQVAKLVSPSVVHIMRERTATAEPDPLQEMFERFFRGQPGTPSQYQERAYG